jgi:hypothetical protein
MIMYIFNTLHANFVNNKALLFQDLPLHITHQNTSKCVKVQTSFRLPINAIENKKPRKTY